MSKFIFDHAGQRAISINHISTVKVCLGNVIPKEQLSKRCWNVECKMKNNQEYTLAKGFDTESEALKWMKGLGFLK